MRIPTKNILFCSFLLFLSCSNGTNNNSDSKNDTIQTNATISIGADTARAQQLRSSATAQSVYEITACCKKLDSFSAEVQEQDFAGTGNLMDSIKKINKKITSLIIHHPQDDEHNFVELLKANTDIRITTSANGALTFYTWSDAPVSQTLFSTATIVSYSADKKRIIKPFNDGNSIDTVYTIMLDGRQICLIASSSTIGSAHIVNKINAYEITGDKLVAVKKIFGRNGRRYDDLNFEYFLNTKIDGEPGFRIDDSKNLVFMPIITKGLDSVAGERDYVISLPR